MFCNIYALPFCLLNACIHKLRYAFACVRACVWFLPYLCTLLTFAVLGGFCFVLLFCIQLATRNTILHLPTSVLSYCPFQAVCVCSFFIFFPYLLSFCVLLLLACFVFFFLIFGICSSTQSSPCFEVLYVFF